MDPGSRARLAAALQNIPSALHHRRQPTPRRVLTTSCASTCRARSVERVMARWWSRRRTRLRLRQQLRDPAETSSHATPADYFYLLNSTRYRASTHVRTWSSSWTTTATRASPVATSTAKTASRTKTASAFPRCSRSSRAGADRPHLERCWRAGGGAADSRADHPGRLDGGCQHDHSAHLLQKDSSLFDGSSPLLQETDLCRRAALAGYPPTTCATARSRTLGSASTA